MVNLARKGRDNRAEERMVTSLPAAKVPGVSLRICTGRHFPHPGGWSQGSKLQPQELGGRRARPWAGTHPGWTSERSLDWEWASPLTAWLPGGSGTSRAAEEGKRERPLLGEDEERRRDTP